MQFIPGLCPLFWRAYILSSNPRLDLVSSTHEAQASPQTGGVPYVRCNLESARAGGTCDLHLSAHGQAIELLLLQGGTGRRTGVSGQADQVLLQKSGEAGPAKRLRLLQSVSDHFGFGGDRRSLAGLHGRRAGATRSHFIALRGGLASNPRLGEYFRLTPHTRTIQHIPTGVSSQSRHPALIL